jgi:hypothetical protein
MGAYKVLQELEKSTFNELVNCGILKKKDLRDMRIFSYYQDAVVRMPRMDARTATSMHFDVSEELVSKIIRKWK